jgi:hypothetical protein
MGVRIVSLAQGVALAPVTEAALERFGNGAFEDGGFLSLPADLEDLARRTSTSGGQIAYVDVELFGGTGGQSAILWRDGLVAIEPAVTKFGWDGLPVDKSPRPEWAINRHFHPSSSRS